MSDDTVIKLMSDKLGLGPNHWQAIIIIEGSHYCAVLFPASFSASAAAVSSVSASTATSTWLPIHNGVAIAQTLHFAKSVTTKWALSHAFGPQISLVPPHRVHNHSAITIKMKEVFCLKKLINVGAEARPGELNQCSPGSGLAQKKREWLLS